MRLQAWTSQLNLASQRNFTAQFRRLTKEFKWVQEMRSDKQEQLMECLSYSCCDDGDIIFKQGDDGDRCYILLSGEVQISRAGPVDDAMHIHYWSSKSADVSASTRKATGNLASMFDSATAAARANLTNVKSIRGGLAGLGSRVATLVPGVMFGDLSLLEGTNRSISAVSVGECRFFYVDRDAFDLVLKDALTTVRHKEMAALARPLLQQFSFFNTLKPEAQDRQPEILHYQRGHAGDLIFRMGDPPGNCYLLLSGEVAIWKNDLNEQGEDSPQSPVGRQASVARKVYDAKQEDFANGLRLADNFIELLKQEEMQSAASANGFAALAGTFDEDSLGMKVALLQPGNLFGMQALLSSAPRNASATCTTECEFLYIQKADFERVLKGEAQDAEVPVLVTPLLKEVPFFAKLRPDIQVNLPYIMKHSFSKSGSVLFSQGDPPGRCYLILSGEVSVACGAGEENDGLDVKRQAQAEESEALLNACALVLEKLGKAEEEKSTADSQRDHSSPRRQPSTQIVATLGVGKIFGRRGTCAESQSYTVTCTEDCHFLVIEKQDFDTVLKEELISAKVAQVSFHIRRLLNEFPFFKRFSASIQEQLPQMVRYCTYGIGDVIYREGDPPGPCYIVLSGNVRTWRRITCGCGEPVRDRNRICPRCRALRPKGPPKCFCGNVLLNEAAFCRRCGTVRAAGNRDLLQCPEPGCAWIGEESKFKQHRIEHINNRHNLSFDERTSKADLHNVRFAPRQWVNARQFDEPVAKLVHNSDTGATLLDLCSLISMYPMGADVVVQKARIPPEDLWQHDAEQLKWSDELARSRAKCLMKELMKLGVREEQLQATVEEGHEAAVFVRFYSDGKVQESISVYEKPSASAQQKCSSVGSMLSEELRTAIHCHCGNLLSEDANYCNRCGTKLPFSLARSRANVMTDCGDCESTPVADLGPGCFFGHPALINDLPRRITVTCSSDCEFLYIERSRIAEIIHQEQLQKEAAHKEKMAFLLDHLSVLRKMPAATASRLGDYFEKHAFPLHHTFFAQGKRGEGSYYMVWQGSVELLIRGEPQVFKSSHVRGSGLRRLGVLQAGAIFASSSPRSFENFTAAVTSAPCEVLRLARAHFRNMPESVLKALKGLDDQTTAWRLSRADSNCTLPRVDCTAMRRTFVERPNTPLGQPKEGLKRPWHGKPGLVSKMPQIAGVMHGGSPLSNKSGKAKALAQSRSLSGSTSLPAII
eukprot:TRINITY_DN18295_c0_g1_i1.p1 TRINITY_DN18295_c0_g1~~TRINITY_DN18295_c0_g1_i1.p1  ORF type:complete len:1219 (-),score=195.11 TRINITY_DN18295_c0_g1_i1:45-3701(-)